VLGLTTYANNQKYYAFPSTNVCYIAQCTVLEADDTCTTLVPHKGYIYYDMDVNGKLI
jgi:hypothetical protein